MVTVVVTTPSTITATATDPNTVAVAVSAASTVTVTASVGNVGDMTKAVYDTDNDGIVDNSEALGGVAASGYVQAASANYVDLTDGGLTSLHTHYSYYTIQTAGIAAISPADASTYYFGGDAAATTTANIRRMYFPFTGTLVYAQVNIQVFGTLGDAATFSAYIRINNTTDLTITTSAVATAAYQQYQAALSQAVIGGTTYFEGKIVFPTWATTNPTNVKAYFVVGVQV